MINIIQDLDLNNVYGYAMKSILMLKLFGKSISKPGEVKNTFLISEESECGSSS